MKHKICHNHLPFHGLCLTLWFFFLIKVLRFLQLVTSSLISFYFIFLLSLPVPFSAGFCLELIQTWAHLRNVERALALISRITGAVPAGVYGYSQYSYGWFHRLLLFIYFSFYLVISHSVPTANSLVVKWLVAPCCSDTPDWPNTCLATAVSP